MKIKQIKTIIFTAMLCVSIAVNVSASGIYYLPDVTKEMTSPSYWSDDKELLMTYEEIREMNKKTIATAQTCMYDLKNEPETVDTVALNEAIKNSSLADAKYYLGWTYLGSSEKATIEDFEKIIENTQNPKPKKNQEVLYAVGVRRTNLRTFPSEIPIWDDPADPDFDYQYIATVRVNEPLVITSVSKDGKYYLAKSICCSGWVASDSVAICEDKSQWLHAWDIESEDALVVWGDKVYTETSLFAPETSALMLTMGTVLKLGKNLDPSNLIDNRAPYNSYAVWIPTRNSEGFLEEKLTLISSHNKVSEGYLPLTRENISNVAFSSLGSAYGWGGSLFCDDCSGYIRSVYKCFGLELARNTSWQGAMPMEKVDMQYMCKEERLIVLDSLPLGAILFFNGHEMMYLGKRDQSYYVISSVSTIMNPENPDVRQRVRGTIINTLEVRRANGNTWLEDLTLALVPYYNEGADSLPKHQWYHDGVAFCLKNEIMQGDENKLFNPSSKVTWAQLLQIIYNMSGEEEAQKDDKEEALAWYDSAIGWARENKLFYEEDSRFEPNQEITRQELASVLYLYASYKGCDTKPQEDSKLSSYSDFMKISKHALPAMEYMVGEGIINGKSPESLSPEQSATRAEVAVIIQRFSDSMKAQNNQ